MLAKSLDTFRKDAFSDLICPEKYLYYMLLLLQKVKKLKLFDKEGDSLQPGVFRNNSYISARQVILGKSCTDFAPGGLKSK